jgi:hypothetical protein
MKNAESPAESLIEFPTVETVPIIDRKIATLAFATGTAFAFRKWNRTGIPRVVLTK